MNIYVHDRGWMGAVCVWAVSVAEAIPEIKKMWSRHGEWAGEGDLVISVEDVIEYEAGDNFFTNGDY